MLILELTQGCNNACRFCSQAQERASSVQRDEAAIAAQLAEARAQVVALVGGEPTLHPGMPATVSRALEHGAAAVWVQTNGRRLAYRNYAQELARSGVQALEISIQGSTAAMHEYHTRAEGSFAQTVRGIANASQAGMRVVVTTVVTRSNLRHLDAIVGLAHRAGAGAVRLRRVRAVGAALGEQCRLVPAPALAAAHLYEARAAGEQVRVPVYFESVSDPSQPFVPWVGGPAEAQVGEAARSGEGAGITGRARPALGESRGRDRLSGEALRDIFPALFDSGQEKR